MSSGAKIIDFNEAAKRLRKDRKAAMQTAAVVQPVQVRTISIDEIEKVLSKHPELECLREKGVKTPQIAAWLERFPAMSLDELIAILRYAAQKMKDGESERIIDYLFQPLTPDRGGPG